MAAYVESYMSRNVATSFVFVSSMGASRMAKQLLRPSQKAISADWTSGMVTPGMARMETLPFSWKAWRPVRRPGPSSLPR